MFTRVGERTEIVEILVRRYVCLGCGAVVLVVPADIAWRHLYTRVVIAGALAHWSYAGFAAKAVRTTFGAFRIVGSAVTGWPSLKRWSRASTRLWPRLRPIGEQTPRAAAYAASAQLSAFAPIPTGNVLDDAPAGSIHAA